MRPLNMLFLCTGNSARSILAEALMNQLPLTAGKFRGFSAGSQPKGEVHPFALDLLRSQRMSVEGLRSKSWDEFGAAIMLRRRIELLAGLPLDRLSGLALQERLDEIAQLEAGG